MTEFDTISVSVSSIRDTVGTDGQLAYVKGYYTPGDGGGGTFIYKQSSAIPDDTGVHLKPNLLEESELGRWVRLYDGYINVAWFGAIGIWGPYTEQIKKAIEFAKWNITNDDPPYGTQYELKVSTIFIPNGNYVVEKIDLLDGVSLIGENLMHTTIYPLYIRDESSSDYLINIPKGRLRINISNLQFIGRYSTSGNPDGNSKKSVFNFIAAPGPPLHDDGGISTCTFKNINIGFFDGNGIYLKGGTDNYYLPDQTSVFENVRYMKGDHKNDSFGLKIEGQNGQLTFINCSFDGGYAGTNEISISPNVIMKGYSLGGSHVFTPSVISFLNCTFQNSVCGISLDKVTNVTIDNCWFERLHVGITVNGTGDGERNDWPCKSINIVNNLFSNVSGYGSIVPPKGYTKKDGACIQAKMSHVNILNNFVITSTDNVWNGEGTPPTDWYIDPSCTFVYAFPDNLGINMSGNTSSSKYIGRTFGLFHEVISTDNIVSCAQHRIIYLKAEAPSTGFNFIDSTLNTTEILTIKAVGQIKFIKLSTGNENISFPTSYPNNTFILEHGEVANFIKIDVGGYEGTFQLISVIRNNP